MGQRAPAYGVVAPSTHSVLIGLGAVGPAVVWYEGMQDVLKNFPPPPPLLSFSHSLRHSNVRGCRSVSPRYSTDHSNLPSGSDPIPLGSVGQPPFVNFSLQKIKVRCPGEMHHFHFGEIELEMPSLASPGIIPHASVIRSNKAFHDALESHCVSELHSYSSFRSRFSKLRSHHLWKVSTQGTATTSLRRLHIYASSDEDYRSSRNIAISLIRRYRNVIDRGGGDNLKEFISAGVNAYALGCTAEGLRKELMNMKDSGTEIEGLQTYGGGTSVGFKILSREVHECILWLSIVFITILCTPQPTIVRWSSTPPVSTEITLQWKGFCALIANAYYLRGMAWLPVKTLQLEQMAVMGSAEEPSVVASRMRLVFSTLEVVSPQWPRV